MLNSAVCKIIHMFEFFLLNLSWCYNNAYFLRGKYHWSNRFTCKKIKVIVLPKKLFGGAEEAGTKWAWCMMKKQGRSEHGAWWRIRDEVSTWCIVKKDHMREEGCMLWVRYIYRSWSTRHWRHRATGSRGQRCSRCRGHPGIQADRNRPADRLI